MWSICVYACLCGCISLSLVWHDNEGDILTFPGLVPSINHTDCVFEYVRRAVLIAPHIWFITWKQKGQILVWVSGCRIYCRHWERTSDSSLTQNLHSFSNGDNQPRHVLCLGSASLVLALELQGKCSKEVIEACAPVFSNVASFSLSRNHQTEMTCLKNHLLRALKDLYF